MQHVVAVCVLLALANVYATIRCDLCASIVERPHIGLHTTGSLNAAYTSSQIFYGIRRWLYHFWAPSTISKRYIDQHISRNECDNRIENAVTFRSLVYFSFLCLPRMGDGGIAAGDSMMMSRNSAVTVSQNANIQQLWSDGISTKHDRRLDFIPRTIDYTKKNIHFRTYRICGNVCAIYVVFGVQCKQSIHTSRPCGHT